MAVTAQLELEASQRKRLAAILQCKESEVERRLAPYATAALEEYVRMFTGERVFTRGSDIREYRLFLLIRHVFGGTIPDERQVSALFQTTASQSRTLLRSVLSKFQYELEPVVRDSLRAAVEAAVEGEGGTWQIELRSQSAADVLNDLIARLSTRAKPLPLLTPNASGANVYTLANSARNALRKEFGAA
jgi:hypothetical protein